jgi:hypothetical protein
LLEEGADILFSDLLLLFLFLLFNVDFSSNSLLLLLVLDLGDAASLELCSSNFKLSGLLVVLLL